MVLKGKVKTGKRGGTLRNFWLSSDVKHHNELIGRITAVGRGYAVTGVDRSRKPLIKLPPYAYDAVVEYNKLGRFVGDKFLMRLPLGINGKDVQVDFIIEKITTVTTDTKVLSEESVNDMI